jgi:hypothetical protein
MGEAPAVLVDHPENGHSNGVCVKSEPENTEITVDVGDRIVSPLNVLIQICLSWLIII